MGDPQNHGFQYELSNDLNDLGVPPFWETSISWTNPTDPTAKIPSDNETSPEKKNMYFDDFPI